MDDDQITPGRMAYLDLSVMDEARPLVMSPRAALILSRDGAQVLWANARGARMVGSSTVRPLVEGETVPQGAVMRQIADHARALEGDPAGASRDGMVRARTDFRTRLVHFDLSVLDLPNGTTGLLMVTDALGDASPARDAQDACDALDGYGHASAIVDADGAVVARSTGYDALRIGADTLHRLVEEVRDEDDRLVKRPIRVDGGDDRRAAGIARLHDDPALHLLVVASQIALPDMAARDEPAMSEPAEPEARSVHEAPEPRRWFYRAGRGDETGSNDEAEAVEPDVADDEPEETTDAAFIAPEEEDEVASEADVEALLALDGAPVAPPAEAMEALLPEVDGEPAEDDVLSFTQLADAIDEEERETQAAEPDADVDADDAAPEADLPDDEVRSEGKTSSAAIGFGIAAAAVAAGGLVRTVEHTEPSDEVEAETAEALALNEAEGGDVGGDTSDFAVEPESDHASELEPDDPFEGIDVGDEPMSAAASGDFVFEPAPRPTRFVWSLDADTRFRSVSPDLARAVGPDCARLEGRAWREVADEYGFDADGAVEALLRKGDTWSGRKVMWPVEGERVQVPVDLAGLPAFGRDRMFEGFNGFGIVHTNEAVPLPGEEADDATDDDDPQAAPETSETDTSVIDLGERRREGGLSVDERQAFRRIGERLAPGHDEPVGGDNADEPVVDVAEEHGPLDQPDEIEDESEALGDVADELARADEWRVSPAHGVDTSILERLPVPVVAYRGYDLLFANPPFREATGFEDLEALAAGGGIDALFGGSLGEREGAPVRHRDGHELDVRAHLQSVPWDDARATLLTLRNPPKDGGRRKGDGRGGGDGPPGGRSPSPKLAVAEAGAPKAARPALSIVASDADDASGRNVAATLSRDELRDILDTAADGVVILDVNGVVEGLNRSAEALFDVDGPQIAGSPFTALLAPESHRSAMDYIGGLHGTGVASVLNDGRELIGRTRGGGLVPLFVTIGTVEAGDRLCAVIRDMSNWKRTEEDLIAARAEAQRESETKTEFLANMSHELRTPLNAIIGFSEMMIGEQFGPIGNDRYLRYLQDIRRSGEHVLDIVNDLLDISKIEAGSMDLDFDALSLNTVVTETCAMMQAQANRERIVIRTSLDAELPQVVADARSMRQILMNLVANAIQFTGPGGQVIVSTAYDEGSVTMRVRDTGIGMTDDQLRTALKPFQQVRAAQPAPAARGKGRKGTGLGLPLTKALTDANCARFRIESEPQEGTLVEILFPAQRVLVH